MQARRPLVSALLAVLLLSLMATGCASLQTSEQVGDVRIHTLRLAHNNVYLVAKGDHAFLVDSGRPKDAATLDHAGGALHFQRKHKTRVVAGRSDEPMLSTGKNQTLCPTDLIGRMRVDQHQNETY
ncbi:MAG: glyoxylase-like metal-dependent hydrolase (beta-lactamase superfamily II), partial [Myxococcota bacterium]